MDYHSMKRKDLQALCKKHKIPANLSNLELANRLAQHFKEIESSSNQGLGSGKSESACETESTDVVTNKKVRFRPEHELIEFSRSPGVRGRTTRRKSVSITAGVSPVEKVESDAENVGGRGRSTRSRGKAVAEEKEDALGGVDDEKITGKTVERTVRVTRSRCQKFDEGALPETKRARKLVENVGDGEGDAKRVPTRRSSSKRVETTGKRKEEVLEGEADAKRLATRHSSKKEVEVDGKQKEGVLEEEVDAKKVVATRRSSRKGVEIDGKHEEGVLEGEADGKRAATRRSYQKGVEIDGKQKEGVLEDEAKAKRVATRKSSQKGVEVDAKQKVGVLEDEVNGKGVATRRSSQKGVVIDGNQKGVLEDKATAKRVATRSSAQKGVEIKGKQGGEVLEIAEKIEEVNQTAAPRVLEKRSKRNATTLSDSQIITKGSRKSEKSLAVDVNAEIGVSKDDCDGSVAQIIEPIKTEVRKSKRSKDMVDVHVKGRNAEPEEETENTRQLQSSAPRSVIASRVSKKVKKTPQLPIENTRRSSRKTLIHVDHEAEEHVSKPEENMDEFAVDSIAQPRSASKKQEIGPNSAVVVMEVDNDLGSQKQLSLSDREASNGDPGLSSDTKNNSITRKTQMEEQHISIADNSNSNDTDFDGRNVLANSDDLVKDISASNIKGEEIFDSVESDFQLIIEQDVTNIVKNQFDVQLCCQVKGSSRVNTTDDQVFQEDVKVSGIEGSGEAISSADSDLHVNLEVKEAEADKHTQPDSIVVGEEEISVLDNMDLVETREANVIDSSIAFHQNNVDPMEASNCISYDKVEDSASNAQEVIVIASESHEEGNKGALELIDPSTGMVRSIESEETYVQEGIVQADWIDASETTGSAMRISQSYGKGIISPVLEESNADENDEEGTEGALELMDPSSGMVGSIESEELNIQKGIGQEALIDTSEISGSAMCMSQTHGKAIASPVLEEPNTNADNEAGTEGALESGMARSIESEGTNIQKGIVQEALIETTGSAMSMPQTHDKGLTSPVLEESNTEDDDGKDKYESADEFMSDADISIDCAVGKLNDEHICESGVQYAEETEYQSENLHKKHILSTDDAKPSPSWTGAELNSLFEATPHTVAKSLTNMMEKEVEGDISIQSAKTTQEKALLPSNYEEMSVSNTSSGVDREDYQLKQLFSTPFKIDSPTNVAGTYGHEEKSGGAGASIKARVDASMENSEAQIALNEKVQALEDDLENSLYLGCSSDNSEENNSEEPNEVERIGSLNASAIADLSGNLSFGNRVSPKSERKFAPGSGTGFGLSDADNQMSNALDNSLHVTPCHADTNLSQILIDNFEGPMDGEEVNTGGCLNSEKDFKNKGTSPSLSPKASNDGEDVTEMVNGTAGDDAYDAKIWDEDDGGSRSFHIESDDVKPSQSWTGAELNSLFETTPHTGANSVTNMIGKEMEEEISSESAKTEDENTLLPTNYKEVSVSNPSSGVDREDVGSHLKQLFSTPVKISSFSMVDETSSEEEKLDGADLSIAERVDTNIENPVAQITSNKKVLTPENDVESSSYLECSPDNGEEINSEEPNEVETVELPNASTTDLYESSVVNLAEKNLKRSGLITEENRDEKVIALGEATDNHSELREGYTFSLVNSDLLERCQDLSDNLNFGNRVSPKTEMKIAPSRGAGFQLSDDADIQKSNVLESSHRPTAYYEDNNLNEILPDTFKVDPMDAEVTNIVHSLDDEEDAKNKGTSLGLLLKDYNDGEDATEMKHETVDEKDGDSGSFCDISDEPNSAFEVEKSKSPVDDIIGYPSACKAAGTIARNLDNTLPAAEGGFSLPGAEGDVFSNLEFHMSAEDSGDSWKSEEGAHISMLVGDHEKNSKGIEENSISISELQLEEKTVDSGNNDSADYESGEIGKSDSGTPLFDLDDGDNEEKNDTEVEENSTAATTVEHPISELHLEDEILESYKDVPAAAIGSNEFLKESDVGDTIKEYIDSELDLNADGLLSLGMECKQQGESICGDDVHVGGDKHVEEMLLEESDPSSVDLVGDSGGKRSAKDRHVISTSSGEFGLTAKKNAILIHGTPGKAVAIADMKENPPTHKNVNAGDATAARPPKRKALQDVQWK